MHEDSAALRHVSVDEVAHGGQDANEVLRVRVRHVVQHEVLELLREARLDEWRSVRIARVSVKRERGEEGARDSLVR